MAKKKKGYGTRLMIACGLRALLKGADQGKVAFAFAAYVAFLVFGAAGVGLLLVLSSSQPESQEADRYWVGCGICPECFDGDGYHDDHDDHVRRLLAYFLRKVNWS